MQLSEPHFPPRYAPAWAEDLTEPLLRYVLNDLELAVLPSLFTLQALIENAIFEALKAWVI